MDMAVRSSPEKEMYSVTTQQATAHLHLPSQFSAQPLLPFTFIGGKCVSLGRDRKRHFVLQLLKRHSQIHPKTHSIVLPARQQRTRSILDLPEDAVEHLFVQLG